MFPLRARVITLALLSFCLAALVLPRAGAQDVAPQLAWEPWKNIGADCGGAQYYVAISKDDGRNDFQLKLKIENKSDHTIQTRFDAVIESETGEKVRHPQGGLGRLNANRTAEACSMFPSLCLGTPFPSAVNQKTPTRIKRLILTNIDVANIDAPPANAPSSAYLDPYRDYPNVNCKNLSIPFGGGSPASSSSPVGSGVTFVQFPAKFIRLTDNCVKGLPHWTKPDCNDAVDELIRASKRTTSSDALDCMKEWRTYQKCYEIYAYNSAPDPKPSCQRPTCEP